MFNVYIQWPETVLYQCVLSREFNETANSGKGYTIKDLDLATDEIEEDVDILEPRNRHQHPHRPNSASTSHTIPSTPTAQLVKTRKLPTRETSHSKKTSQSKKYRRLLPSIFDSQSPGMLLVRHLSPGLFLKWPVHLTTGL
jgi:hypothetical protein